MFRFIDWLERKCRESNAFAWGVALVATLIIVLIAYL